MSGQNPRLDLDRVEQRLRVIAAKQLGLAVDEVQPESRLIEDLNCDSLDMVELLMEMEDEFSTTIPEKSDTPVGKHIFTRQPFRIRDLAEYAFLKQGTGPPVRRRWRERLRKQNVEASVETPRDFSQLGGRFDRTKYFGENLHEPLESLSNFPNYRRVTDGMVCVQIPACTIKVGNEKVDADPDEGPIHDVKLSGFLADIEPVSVTAFCRFLNSIDASLDELVRLVDLPVGDNRRKHMQFSRLDHRWRPRCGTEMQPVVMVAWSAANAFSLWANGRDWRKYKTGKSFLPTEAQWQCAAQDAFPMTNEAQHSIQAAAHGRGDSYEDGVMPIAEVYQPFGVSRYGLRHMSGTIWHWCRDWFDPDFYDSPNARLLNPLADTPTGIRSERGGSWIGPIELCRPNYRRGRNPEARGRCLGFRCVTTSPESRIPFNSTEV